MRTIVVASFRIQQALIARIAAIGRVGSVGRFSVCALLMLCLAPALVGCAWLDTKQRELVLRPTPGRPADFKGLRPSDLSFSVDVKSSLDEPAGAAHPSERLQMWWLPHADPQAPTLLYLHGTFRNLYQNLPKIDSLRAAGFSVLAVDYRGWGDSSPIIPSEATILADAAVAWAQMQQRQPDPRRRVIYGHSMGSGVAVDLASRLHGGIDYSGLILESSFPRLPDVARAIGTLGSIAALFATQEFDSLAKIGKVDAPVLMLHGSADTTVPIALGRRLLEAAPADTRWVTFEGGSHSGIDRDQPASYREVMTSFIDRLASSPRPAGSAPSAH